MQRLLQRVLYLGYDRKSIESCRASLDEDNLRTVKHVSLLLMTIIGILLAFYTLFDFKLSRNLICLVAAALLLVIYFVARALLRDASKRSPFRVDCLIDCFSFLCFTVAIYLGTFAAREDLAVAPVWMFFFAVLIFNRLPLRNLLVLGISGTVFFVCSFMLKDAHAFGYDVMHGVTSILGSLFMSWSKSRMKVEHALAVQTLESANLAIMETVEEQEREAALLRHRANRDELTGLYKRGAFMREVQDCLDLREHGGIRALACADIDNFKNINDSFGHLFGDKVIKDLTEAIRTGLYDGSIAGRFGGDEFLVFTSPADSVDELLARISEVHRICARSYTVGGVTQSVSLSVGIALFPRDGHTYEELFKKADIALYRAKAMGKNCYCLYSAEPDSRAQ